MTYLYDPMAAVVAAIPGARQRGDEWRFPCPAHGGDGLNAVLRRGDDGGAVLHCHSRGCPAPDIAAALGIGHHDQDDRQYRQDRHERSVSLGNRTPRPKAVATAAAPPKSPKSAAALAAEERRKVAEAVALRGKPVAVYTYTDADGAPARIKRRYQFDYVGEGGELTRGKTFRWHHPCPDGSGQQDGAGDAPRVLYRLPAVLAAVGDGRRVYLVEGEKAADALAALGATATTHQDGATAWKAADAAWLSGAHVICLPDNDAPGERFAADVSASVGPIAASLRFLRFPDLPEKADVYDWARQRREAAKGAGMGTQDALRAVLADLDALADAEPVWTPEAVTEGRQQEGGADWLPALVPLSQVAAEVPRWLWRGRIAYGALNLLDGDPGQGKSTLTADIAARLTRGLPMPGEEEAGGADGTESGAVLFLAGEDSPAHTQRPRLEAAGADLERVYNLSTVPAAGGGERSPVLPHDGAYIGDYVARYGIRLVVIDPIMAYLHGDTNSYRDQDVRAALAPLAQIAQETGCAVLLLRHLNKGGGTHALYRGGGSIGIIGAARVALLLAPDPNDPQGNRRIVAPEKNNLAPMPPALAFRIEGASVWTDDRQEIETSRLSWEGEAEGVTAGSLLAAQGMAAADGDQRTAEDEAAEFLRETLAAGPLPSAEIYRESRGAGISERTLKRAKKAAGVVTTRVSWGTDGKGRWDWSLPAQGGQAVQESGENLQGGQENGKGAIPKKWPPCGNVGPLAGFSPFAPDPQGDQDEPKEPEEAEPWDGVSL